MNTAINVTNNGVGISVIAIDKNSNSKLFEKFSKLGGCNYFIATKDEDLEKYLIHQFNYMTFVTSYNIKLDFESDDCEIIKAIGTNSDDNKNVVGIITDRDITLRCVACGKDATSTPTSDIMTTSVCCCESNTDIQDATKLMSDMQVRRIPVLEKDRLVGILTLGDLANNKNVSAKEVSDTVENICKSGNNTKNNY